MNELSPVLFHRSAINPLFLGILGLFVFSLVAFSGAGGDSGDGLCLWKEIFSLKLLDRPSRNRVFVFVAIYS